MSSLAEFLANNIGQICWHTLSRFLIFYFFLFERAVILSYKSFHTKDRLFKTASLFLIHVRIIKEIHFSLKTRSWIETRQARGISLYFKLTLILKNSINYWGHFHACKPEMDHGSIQYLLKVIWKKNFKLLFHNFEVHTNAFKKLRIYKNIIFH